MSDIQDSVEQLIEQAHLAILRQSTERARTLLKKALTLDPMHQEALRMLQSLPTLQNSQPRLAGESENDFAARIAYQAGAEEQARLNGGYGTPGQRRLYFALRSSGPTSSYINVIALAACILVGILVVMYLPLGRIHPFTFRTAFHLDQIQSILAGTLLGVVLYFVPRSRPRYRRW